MTRNGIHLMSLSTFSTRDYWEGIEQNWQEQIELVFHKRKHNFTYSPKSKRAELTSETAPVEPLLAAARMRK